MVRLAVTIDVPDLARGVAFYTAAWGLTAGRCTGDAYVELDGAGVPVCLIAVAEGSAPAPGAEPRDFHRHWSPVHVDRIVDDLDAAAARAEAARARAETPVRDDNFGRIVTLADPFGHGFCLIEARGGDDAAA